MLKKKDIRITKKASLINRRNVIRRLTNKPFEFFSHLTGEYKACLISFSVLFLPLRSRYLLFI